MIEAKLSHWLDGDKVPHGLLFIGDSSQTSSSALEFAKKLVGCEKDLHPDIHQITPEGKTSMHALSSIRAFLYEAILSPYSGKKKCFIIHDAERMLQASANALLKIVEEPPPKTHFFFLTRYKEKILPTIVSRLQTVYFPEKTDRPTSAPAYTALQEAFLSVLFENGDMDVVIKMLETGKKEREKALYEDLPAEITALQKEVYEKEIESMVTMRYHEEFMSLLEIVLDWHRDLCILESGIPATYLRFSQSRKKDRYPAWDLVDKALRDAKEGLERNINAKTILESLIFRLGL